MQAKKTDVIANAELRRRRDFGLPLTEIARYRAETAATDGSFLKVLRGRCFDLEHAPLHLFIDACRDPEPLAEAAGLMDALREDRGRRNSGSGVSLTVYVIQAGDQSISKIGVSSNPLRRLQGLQEAHYLPLSLYGVLFCPGHNSVSIEQEVLRRNAANGRRLMGEWVIGEPAEVFAEALVVARDLRVPVCHSELWLENLAIKTRYLARNPAARGLAL